MQGLQQRGPTQDRLPICHRVQRISVQNGSTLTKEVRPARAHSMAQTRSQTCWLAEFSLGFHWFEDGRLRLAVANAGDSRAVLGRKELIVTDR